MLKLNYITLDVFTKTRFAGNPLAIVKVPPSTTLTQAQKQIIAREFNYSETVILQEQDQSVSEVQDGDARPEWKIGIFLTTAEIPFAGHPTIGTACYLGRLIRDAKGKSGDYLDELIHGKVIAKAGPIPFTFNPVSGTSWVDVPHDVYLHDRTLTADEGRWYGLVEEIVDAFVRPPPFISLVKGMTFILAELPSIDALRHVRAGLKDINVDGQLNSEWHPDGTFTAFVFFVVLVGTDGVIQLRTRVVFGSTEDPATGAASCALVAYLALHYPGVKRVAGLQRFEITQGVEIGRESFIQLEVVLNESRDGVEVLRLGGEAVEIMEGSISL